MGEKVPKAQNRDPQHQRRIRKKGKGDTVRVNLERTECRDDPKEEFTHKP